MAVHDPKANLKEYLQGGRDTLLWKLSGLSEYDIRRPLVPTGTNLLGLVKHKAHSEFVYLGDTFERPSGEPLTWFQSAEPNADMWATVDESRQEIVELYQRAWTHSDATIAALPWTPLDMCRIGPPARMRSRCMRSWSMSSWTPSATPGKLTSFES